MASTSGGMDPPLFSPNDRTLPDWMDGDGSHGVLMVLQLKMKVEGKPLPKNPFIIAKTVLQTAGKIASAYSENRGLSMVLKVRSEKQAQQLKRIDKLIDGTEIVIIDHPTLNQNRCVVSCSQTIGMSETQLMEELKEQGVVGVRKFTRVVNGTKTETASMVLTIKGTVKPEFIFFGFQRCNARLYIPSPMLCFNCYEFGHSKMRCNNAAVCRHCSTTHEQQMDTEGRPSCKKAGFCKNCQGNHGPSSRNCPRYVEEAEIAKIRTEQKISFSEAKQLVTARKSTTSYAATARKDLPTIDPRERAKELELIATLKQELEKEKKEKERLTKDWAEEVERLRQENKKIRVIANQNLGYEHDRKAIMKKMEEEAEKLRQEVEELRKQLNTLRPTSNMNPPIGEDNFTEVLPRKLSKKEAMKKVQQKQEEKKTKDTPSPEHKKLKKHQDEQPTTAQSFLKENPTTKLTEQRKTRQTQSNQTKDRSRSRSRMRKSTDDDDDDEDDEDDDESMGNSTDDE